MPKTPEFEPRETLVLDDDELAELEESSLTSIMRDADRLHEMLEARTEPQKAPDAGESEKPETAE